jgi:hypothetical protein
MERHTLRIVIVLGVLVTLLGGTGIFAVFTDRATTGTNSAETGSRQQAVDLKIEQALLDAAGVNCDGNLDGMLFNQDDLATGIFSVSGMQPGNYPADADTAYVCLFNAGSGTIDVEATVIDLVDTDTGCTGDEAAAGDTTCGSNQVGELGGAIAAQMEQLDCNSTAASTPIQSNSLAYWPASPAPLNASLAPGDVACLAFYLWVPASTDETTLQLVQSDKVEWRFAFDAALAP